MEPRNSKPRLSNWAKLNIIFAIGLVLLFITVVMSLRSEGHARQTEDGIDTTPWLMGIFCLLYIVVLAVAYFRGKLTMPNIVSRTYLKTFGKWSGLPDEEFPFEKPRPRGGGAPHI